jgi:uncharacterized protein (DUF2267 family)
MVNTTRATELTEVEAIEVLKRQISPEDLSEVLSGLVGMGGISIDHEALRLSGTYAHAARVALLLDSITANLPKLIETVWSDTRAAELNKHEKVVEQIEDATNRLIQQAFLNKQAPVNVKNIIIGISALSIGFFASTLFSHFVLFPQQLRQARVGDGEVMEWLATPDGKLLKATFRSGNRSVRDCVKRAGNLNLGQKQIVCEIAIKKS